MGSQTRFYTDKPLFGLDIGHGSVKVMQIDTVGKKRSVSGYGVATFPPEAIENGVIIDIETVAKSVHDLFKNHLIGTITTRRVAAAVPAARTFSRSIALPPIEEKDLPEAVRLEAEQYIPVPIEELYLDYTITNKSSKGTDLMAVAVPQKIINSYTSLFEVLNIEPVIMETTISAASRSFSQSDHNNDVPTILIDFGSLSADVTIYDKSLLVTGTVPCGGEIFTDLIAKKLKVTQQEAQLIKAKYGLGLSKKQVEITSALAPVLDQLAKETKRMIRYYEERFGSVAKIGQIVTMGGGATMPGLSDYMTNLLRLPVNTCNPWSAIDFAGLQSPQRYEQSIYVTVAGLALINPKEVFMS